MGMVVEDTVVDMVGVDIVDTAVEDIVDIAVVDTAGIHHNHHHDPGFGSVENTLFGSLNLMVDWPCGFQN